MDTEYKAFVAILREELIPAMGCTEPIAVAYCAAAARDALGVEPDRVRIEASGNIIKNVKSVVVPNTGGGKGLETAAAAGIVAGDANRRLQVISDVTEEQRRSVREWSKRVPITVHASSSGLIFDIDVTLWRGEERAECRIVGNHTNIVLLKKNDRVLVEKPVAEDSEAGLTDRGFMTLEKICDFAEHVRIEDVKALLDTQIQYNMAIAREGLSGQYGAGVGATLLAANQSALAGGGPEKTRLLARAMAAAGSDARMSGCELPVVINSGSGNQGITASVPVLVYADALGVSEETRYRALVLSNLIAIYQKTFIGRLSAYCGAVSAGCAAGCAVAYLKGGGLDAIAHTLVNAVSVSSGIVCDGAKASCAAKIAVAVDTGIFGYEMYENGRQFVRGDGIVQANADAMVRGVGRLASEGMKKTDEVILQMMVRQ